MTNQEKLKQLFIDVLLLEESEFSLDLKKEQIDTWDSLGVVSIAVAVQETFGYHFTQEQALSVSSVSDVINILNESGIDFNE